MVEGAYLGVSSTGNETMTPGSDQAGRATVRPAWAPGSGWSLLACLLASAIVLAPALTRAQPVEGTDRPVVITADVLSFDTETGSVVATGSVELTQGDRRLLADRVTYAKTGDKMTAEGNVTLIEPTGQVLFADEVELTGELRNGMVRRLRALLADNARLASSTGRLSDGVTTFTDGVYSPCPICADGRQQPLWQVRAREIEHDQATRDITYRDARLEMFGVPMAWTPWFRYPDPTVKRRSGLLTPTVGTSSTLGLTWEQPYFWAIAPNRDLTLTPLVSTKSQPVLAAEYRGLQRPGETTFSGSSTYTEAYSSSGDQVDGNEWRGHVNGRGRYRVQDYDAGFDLALVSDNSYLQRYGFGNDDVLESHGFLQKFSGRDYLGLHAYGFQGLRDDDDQGLIPVVLPLIETKLRSSKLRWGSELALDSSVVALTRSQGLDTQRLSSEARWHVPQLGPIGDIWGLTLAARGDIYNYQGDASTFEESGDRQKQGRFVPRATVDWSWPLGGSTGQWSNVVEPTVMATITPGTGNQDNFPNEDSQSFEFDETNLFEPSRFTGLDRVDGGAKIAYGVRFSSIAPSGIEISGLLGQSYQPSSNPAVPTDSGVSTSFSDLVGRLDFRPSDYVDIRYRFRLERQNVEFRRSDLNLAFGPSTFRFDIGWLRLSDEPTDLGPRSREELSAGLRIQIMDNLAIGARTRQDLNENKPVSNMLGLIYTHPCLLVVAGMEKSFTQRGEIDDELTFKLRVSFTGFGGDGGAGGLFGGR